MNRYIFSFIPKEKNPFQIGDRVCLRGGDLSSENFWDIFSFPTMVRTFQRLNSLQANFLSQQPGHIPLTPFILSFIREEFTEGSSQDFRYRHFQPEQQLGSSLYCRSIDRASFSPIQYQLSPPYDQCRKVNT